MPGLDLWYKNAIVYCVDVETFMDGNGDGVGDFEGLTKRLDYLAGIGITCLWLLPFYPTPNRAFGPEPLMQLHDRGGPFRFERVSVATQHRDAGSPLNWMEQVIRTRKEYAEIGWGGMTPVKAPESNIFAHRCDWDGDTVVALHNLSGRGCAARLGLPGDELLRMIDILGDRDYPPIEESEGREELDGYRWFRRGESGF